MNVYSSSALEESTLSDRQTTTRQMTDVEEDGRALSTTDLVVIMSASCIVVGLLGVLAVGVGIHCVRHGRCAGHTRHR